MEHIDISLRSSSKGVEDWQDNACDAATTSKAAYNEDRRPPAYTPTNDIDHVLRSSETCCALQRSSFHIRDISESDYLIQDYRLLAFKSWVADKRRPAQSIPKLERLMCPLLWCRKSFDDHDKLVNHVKTCSHLEEGVYWCPYCQQSERFANASKNARKHFLQGAVKAICRLGSKGIEKAIHPSKTGRGRGTRLFKQHPAHAHSSDNAELEFNDKRDVPELDSFAVGPFIPKAVEQCAQEIPGEEPAFEMADVVSPSFKLRHDDHMDCDDMPCPSMDWESTGVPTPESVLSPISPISPGDRWHTRPFNGMDSPVSPTDFAARSPWATNLTLLSKANTNSRETKESAWSYPSSKLPEIHIDTSLTTLTAFMWPVPTSNSMTTSTSAHTINERLPYAPNIVEEKESVSGASDNESLDYTDAQYDEPYIPTGHVGDFDQSTMQPWDENRRRNEVMRTVITEPLITRMRLEGFLPIVTEVNRRLNGTWNVSVRELQLDMIHDGLIHTRSRDLFEQYATSVNSACDRASSMLGGECTPLDQQCLRDIDCLLRDFREGQESDVQELDDASHGASDTTHYFELPASGESSRSSGTAWDMSTVFHYSGSGSISPFDDQSQFATDESRFSVPVPVPDIPELESPSMAAAAAYNTPQADTAMSGTAVPESSSPGAPEATLACDECHKVLKGKAVWLPSNMQRHKREKHSGEVKRLTCTRCRKTFSRKHNLNVHMTTVHMKA